MIDRPGTLTDEMKKCIKNCTDCFAMCAQTAAYCLEKGGKHVEATHMGALLDCTETCRTSAALMARSSHLHPKMCGVCAEACQTCAASCAKVADDAQMKACVDVCRACAETCRRMAA